MNKLSKKQNKNQPPKSKALVKERTAEDIRKMILEGGTISCDVEAILDKIAKNLWPKYTSCSKKDKELVGKELDEAGTKVVIGLGIKTHYPLVIATDKEFQPYALAMIKDIIKEYNCKTPSEKALCDVIVTSYIKILTCNSKFNDYANVDYLSSERLQYLAIMSKELDRANRQFISALSLMRQIKSPAIEVNVKAKTAFVSQNQQINANTNLNTKNEINESK